MCCIVVFARLLCFDVWVLSLRSLFRPCARFVCSLDAVACNSDAALLRGCVFALSCDRGFVLGFNPESYTWRPWLYSECAGQVCEDSLFASDFCAVTLKYK